MASGLAPGKETRASASQKTDQNQQRNSLSVNLWLLSVCDSDVLFEPELMNVLGHAVPKNQKMDLED